MALEQPMNGTEAGGGSGYAGMKVYPAGGQSQPQVDPKQQQQPVQGGIQMNFAQQTRPATQIFSRPTTRLSTSRPTHMISQSIPNANIQYTPQTMILPPPFPQAVILPHTPSLQSGRHQSHGGGQVGGSGGGPTPAAFYHSQQQMYALQSPHALQAAYTQYPYMYQMRNNTFPPQNPGPHSGPAAPQPPQHQPQQQYVVESGVRGGGGGGGGGGSQMMPALHQPQQPPQAQLRQRRSHAIAIINPNSGKDITDEIYSETNSGESTASATPHSIPHSERADAVVAAEFAAKVAAAVAPETAAPSAEVVMQPSLPGVVNGPSGGSSAGSPPPPLPLAPTPPGAISDLPSPPTSLSMTPSSPPQQPPPHLQPLAQVHLPPQPLPHLQQQPSLPHHQPQPPLPHLQQQPQPPHHQPQPPPPHIQPQPPPTHHQPQPPHLLPQPPHIQQQPHLQPQTPHIQPQLIPHLHQQQPTPAPTQPQIPTVSAKTDSPPVELPRPKVLTHSPGRKSTPIPSSVQPIIISESKKKDKKVTVQAVVASLPPHREEPEEQQRKSSFADAINIKNLQPVIPVQLPPPQPAVPAAPEPETNGEPEVVLPPPPTAQPKIPEQPPHQQPSHERGKSLGKKGGNKGKKGGDRKEQSRRWQEKEGGSEMDAFVTPSATTAAATAATAPSPPPPAAVTSEPEPAPVPTPTPTPAPAPQAAVLPTPPERVPTPPPAQPQREPTPPPPPHPANSNTQNEDEVEEMDEGEEGDEEAIIVAAKNEENTKVSAQVEETILNDTTVIEKSKPSLKYTYKEGQWSPLNQDGKRVYDRDFLLNLRMDDLSTKRPDIEDCDIIKTDSTNNNSISTNNNNNRRPMHSSNSLSMNRGDGGFAPNFLRSSSSQRGGCMIGKRGSQQGQRPNRDGRGRNMYSSQQFKDIGSDSEQLHWASKGGGWKPDRCKTPPKATEEEIKTENLYKRVRGILNKLTPEMFNKLMDQILDLPIDTIERLTGVVELVFDKAVDEPSFSVAYAKLCQNLNKLSIKIADNEKEKGTGGPEVSFRKILLTKCQHMFEKKKKEEKGSQEEGKKSEEERIAELHQQISDAPDKDKRKEYQLILEEEERKIRVKYVGLARFIGELFKLSMLTSKIMFGCISTLLEKIEEESLECLCKLLTTVGKELEQQIKNTSLMKDLDDCFQKMRNLSRKTAHSKVSSRVRFMLQDVIELRGNKWVPRREDNNPKTMDQIQKEAERETLMESANLMHASNTPRSKHSDRGDDRRRGGPRGGGGGNMDSDGWISTNKFRSYTFEASKLQHLKGTESEPSSQNLGSYGQFKQWGFGSGTASKPQPSNNERRGFDYNTQNKFALLGDEKKMPPIMSRKTSGPSSSQEKERALQSVRDVITPDKSSRQQSSNPPSRDNSRVRSSAKPAPMAPPTSAPEQEQPPPHEQQEPEDPEVLRLNAWVLFEEWLANHNIQESADSISEAFSSDPVIFVNSVMGRVVEGKETQRVAFGNLLAHLTNMNIIPASVVAKELGELIEFGEDLMIDLPFIWKYLGELIVPILAKGSFTFADFKSACENFKTRHLTSTFTEIINRLLKEKGPVFIKAQWESSNVKFSDFIPEVDVDEFIKKNNFGFIIGEGEAETKDAVTSMSEVEKILFDFLVQDGDKVSDHVCEWVKANVGSKSQDVDFIKALMRAVIKACIKNGKIVPSSLNKNSTLIKKFIDTNETRELACLSGILQLVVNEMEHPAGLLVEIFQTLNDNNIISYEAFIKWKMQGVNEMGKGVAMASLSSFYVSLSEQDDSEEDST